jgi:hypothetical protein
MIGRGARSAWLSTLAAAIPLAAPLFGAAAAPVRLSLRVEVERQGRLEVVAEGDRLRSGERLQVQATADRDLYLYLVQFFADGSSAVLHPEQGDRLLPAGYALRLPAAGSWFQLDDALGEENLYFVACERPIAEVDALVASRLREIRTSPGGPAGAAAQPATSTAPAETSAPTPAPEPRPTPRRPRPTSTASAAPTPAAPEGFGLANRGLVRVAGREGVVVELDAGGLAIYRLRFQHVAR